MRERSFASGRSQTRGGALLAVLWLSAALSAIAFTVANTVRGETERTATAADGVRAYYLATGAIQRATLYLFWGPTHRNPDGSPKFYSPSTPILRMSFPSGEAEVEVIPEASRIGLNSAPPEELFRLFLAAGAEPERAREIAMAIVDWRAPAPGGLSAFDQHYLSLVPSFRARHASFEEIEEVLLVKGMTPELFYGTYVPDSDDRLVHRGGVRDCVSVFGPSAQVDINTAEPAVLAAIGLSPAAVNLVVTQRRITPFTNPQQLAVLAQAGGPGFHRLRIGGNSVYTLRATARLRLSDGRLSDLRRTVSSTVKILPAGFDQPFHTLRWYEGAR